MKIKLEKKQIDFFYFKCEGLDHYLSILSCNPFYKSI